MKSRLRTSTIHCSKKKVSGSYVSLLLSTTSWQCISCKLTAPSYLWHGRRILNGSLWVCLSWPFSCRPYQQQGKMGLLVWLPMISETLGRTCISYFTLTIRTQCQEYHKHSRFVTNLCLQTFSPCGLDFECYHSWRNRAQLTKFI